MIGWLIFAWYVVGVPFFTHVYARRCLDSLKFPPYIDNSDKAMSFTVGLFCGLLWPVVAPIREGFRFAVRHGALTTDYEREQAERLRMAAERAELLRLRRQAREYNLPYPEASDDK